MLRRWSNRCRRSGWMWMLTAGATLGLAFAVAPVTQAKMPDGETPAEETVCDSLDGGTAWGLCNAYCEAMDCDSDDPRASDQACQRVLDNFMVHDPGPIPCEAPVCPCFDETDLDDIVARCEAPNSILSCSGPPSADYSLRCSGSGVASFVAVTRSLGPTERSCALVDDDGDPSIFVFNPTIDERHACMELLEAKQSEGVCDEGP